jgi:hypothetical protein
LVSMGSAGNGNLEKSHQRPIVMKL